MGPGGDKHMEHGVGFHSKENRKSSVRFRHTGDIILGNCCYGGRIVGWQE